MDFCHSHWYDICIDCPSLSIGGAVDSATWICRRRRSRHSRRRRFGFFISFLLCFTLLCFVYSHICLLENVYLRFAVDAKQSKREWNSREVRKVRNNTKINKLYDFIYLSPPIRFVFSSSSSSYSSYLCCLTPVEELGRTVAAGICFSFYR